MRESLTPGEFDKWLAFRQVSPDKMDRLIIIVKSGLTLLANYCGAKIEPDDLDPAPKQERAVSPNQAAALIGTAINANRDR